MKTLKIILTFAVILVLSTSVFSQTTGSGGKDLSEKYRQNMGKALDQLTPLQQEKVLEFATKLVEEENTKAVIARIAEYLSEGDQKRLLQFAQMEKYGLTEEVVPHKETTTSTISKGPTTSMEFEESTFDFGVVEEGEKIQYVYKYKNTGTEPLIIINAKGSCGCTVPSWSKEPLAPGETGELMVEFDSKNKSGKQAKRVTISANTDPEQTFLTIKGEVLKKQ